MTKVQRIALLALIAYALLLTTACTTAWTDQALNIITVLEAAIPSALAIVAAFGLAMPPTALTEIAKWGSESTAALRNVVVPLINQYNTAAAEAKPGILSEIEAAIKVITANLATILPTLHIENPETQAKVTAVITAIEAELQALVQLVPVIEGKMIDHDEVKAVLHKLKSAKDFKKDYNEKAAALGDQYTI